MGYTQEIANQNKAMAVRAAILLSEQGYCPSLEITNNNGRLVGSQWQIIQDVIIVMAVEFDGIDFGRVQRQVHGVCRKARGQLWREQQNQ